MAERAKELEAALVHEGIETHRASLFTQCLLSAPVEPLSARVTIVPSEHADGGTAEGLWRIRGRGAMADQRPRGHNYIVMGEGLWRIRGRGAITIQLLPRGYGGSEAEGPELYSYGRGAMADPRAVSESSQRGALLGSFTLAQLPSAFATGQYSEMFF